MHKKFYTLLNFQCLVVTSSALHIHYIQNYQNDSRYQDKSGIPLLTYQVFQFLSPDSRLLL